MGNEWDTLLTKGEFMEEYGITEESFMAMVVSGMVADRGLYPVAANTMVRLFSWRDGKAEEEWKG